MAKRDKDSDSDSGSSSSGDEWGKKAKKKGKRVKSVKEEEEREEGEVDDDEDDDLDDDDDDIDEFNDGFDENLMGDEEDQKRLAEMTEKEREQELFNRSEKREVLRTRFEIERKLRLQKRKESQKGSKNPDFTEASLRSDERRRNIEAKKKQNSALQGLKEQREKKKAKAQILRAADVYSSSSSSDDDDDGGRKGSSTSSSSSSDDSDDDGTRGRKHRNRRSDDDATDDYDFNLLDLNKIRVTRKQLELWVHSPFFPPTMKDSFVKMGIGCRDGKQIYRVCQVIDVVDGPRVYDLEKTKTNKLLKCRHSKDDRNFRLEYVSNADFFQPEFDEWKQRCLRDGVTFPTRSQVENKKRDIESAMNYRYNDSDIAFMLKEKEKFNKTPKNYAMKKTELMKMKEEAEQNNNHDLVHQLQSELDQLEERAKELDKARTHSIAAISYINERNRLKNIAEAEKAILESQDENKAGEADDPFRRRKCAPQLVHKVAKTKNPDGSVKNPDGSVKNPDGSVKNSDGISVKVEPGVKTEPNGSSVVDGTLRAAGDGSSLVNKEMKQERKQSMSPPPDDLFNAHDFDIQIDFDPVGTSMLPSGASVSGNSSFSSITSQGGTDIKPATNRRSLNLEEYKRKKGLI